MPRPSRSRTRTTERIIAARVTYERKSRGWSYETLSKKMMDAGCSIAITSLYRLEQDDPPRRVNVDEALAFCEVFDVSFEDMLSGAPVPRLHLLRALDDMVTASDHVVVAEQALAEIKERASTVLSSMTPTEVDDALAWWRGDSQEAQTMVRDILAETRNTSQ